MSYPNSEQTRSVRNPNTHVNSNWSPLFALVPKCSIYSQKTVKYYDYFFYNEHACVLLSIMSKQFSTLLFELYAILCKTCFLNDPRVVI